MTTVKTKTNLQTVFINIDDSGKLSKYEKVAVYGGIVFFSKLEKSKFITQYKNIINDIKCKYCYNDKDKCIKRCPELKSTNLRANDKRRILNYIKRYFTFAIIVDNSKIYDHILNNTASKGRYLDYALKIIIKEIIKKLIITKKINSNEPIKIIINIDEQTTKSNGYYNLKDGIIEELKYGVLNYNYAKYYKPIIYSDLEVDLKYQHSNMSYTIQAADIIAGTVRRNILNDKESFVDLLKKLP